MLVRNIDSAGFLTKGQTREGLKKYYMESSIRNRLNIASIVSMMSKLGSTRLTKALVKNMDSAGILTKGRTRDEKILLIPHGERYQKLTEYR